LGFGKPGGTKHAGAAKKREALDYSLIFAV